MKNNKEIEEFQQYIIAEAKSQNKNPEQYVKELGESGLKEAYKRFQAYKKKQAQKAAHGAKLQYFKTLKNQCANDEELVYFKRGGVVDCGCQKKQEGGKTEPIKKGNIIDRFKAKKAQVKARLSKIANERKEGWDKHGNYIVTKKGIEERKRQLDANKTEEETTPPNINRGIGKNCNGAKMKLKKGDKVCPKCGKVHAAGIGCAVAKFKMHRQGGSLNGIPFINKEQ